MALEGGYMFFLSPRTVEAGDSSSIYIVFVVPIGIIGQGRTALVYKDDLLVPFVLAHVLIWTIVGV